MVKSSFGGASLPWNTPITVWDGDVVTVVDRVTVEAQHPVAFTLVDEWSETLDLQSASASSGTTTTLPAKLTWNLVGGSSGVEYTLTKTFEIRDGYEWTAAC